MKFQRKKVATTIAMLAGGTLSALAMAPAIAQTPAQPAGTIKVEVTGTNIRRVDSETASPVQVITQEDMVRQGYTTINEVVRDITANGQGLLGQGFVGAFASGGSGVALRGLGVGATLVLIDGLRMSPFPRPDDNQHNFVDISGIPFSAVERIEVLLDGASAIYGSDAIGGVLNIILKKSFTGTGLVVDGGSSTEGGGTMWHASIMQGWGDRSKDNANGFIAFEYRHQDKITINQRGGDWLTQDFSQFTDAGGVNLNPGARSPVVPNPLLLNTPYLQRPLANANDPANNIFLNNNCNLAARNANQCTFQDTWSTLLPETENINVIARGALRFGDSWELVLTGSWFRTEADTTRRQTAINNASFAGNTAFGINVAPFISAPIINYTVPANYPGNTFGVPANVRAILPDVAPRQNDVTSDSTRLVAQLSGSGLGFDWNFAAGYTSVSQDWVQNGYINPYAAYAALNDPVNPFRLTGGNSSDVMGRVAPQVTSGSKSELDFLQFVATRDLMKLDGGQLAMAVGAGVVYLSQNADTPQQFQDGTVTGLLPAYTSGNQTNTNFYMEFVAPVLKTLELDAALRYDYYDTYGGDWTPKVGFKWVPIKEVGFRGTWGQGFRAPGPAESGKSGTAYGFNNIRDPLLCPNPGQANSPQNVTSPVAACGYGPTYLQISNPDLKAEKSTNWTIGMILEPVPKWLTTFDYYSIELKDQIIPAAQTPNYDPIANAVRGPIQNVTFADGSQGLSPAGVIAYINVPLVNAGKTSTTGLDLASSYTFDLPDTSKLMLGVQWSHIFTWDLELAGVTYKLAGTHGPVILTGDTGTPKDRFQATIQWAKGPWTITGTGNYVGSFNLTDPSNGVNNCDDGVNSYQGNQRFTDIPPGSAPSQFCNVDSFWYANFNLQYQVNKQLMVQLSGVNIFNQKPPVDMQTYAGGGANLNNPAGGPYNPSLHMPGVIGPFWSAGLQYNF